MDTSLIEKQAEETDKKYPYCYYLTGIGGEAGEILELHKKAMRSGVVDSFSGNKEALSFEIADLLWYLARLASLNGLTLEECWNKTMEKIKQRNIDGYYQQGTKT